MKVALIQITVGSNFDENFEKSKKFLQDQFMTKFICLTLH